MANAAKLVAGIDMFGIASIIQLVDFLRDEPMPLVDPIEVHWLAGFDFGDELITRPPFSDPTI
jgi:hypothetical protein